jgi:hypothetical protein
MIDDRRSIGSSMNDGSVDLIAHRVIGSRAQSDAVIPDYDLAIIDHR